MAHVPCDMPKKAFERHSMEIRTDSVVSRLWSFRAAAHWLGRHCEAQSAPLPVQRSAACRLFCCLRGLLSGPTAHHRRAPAHVSAR